MNTITGIKSKDDIRTLLLERGISELQNRAGFTPEKTETIIPQMSLEELKLRTRIDTVLSEPEIGYFVIGATALNDTENVRFTMVSIAPGVFSIRATIYSPLDLPF